MLPTGSAVLYLVHHVQLCILPEPVPRREQFQKPWQQCSKLNSFFFLNVYLTKNTVTVVTMVIRV